MVMGTFSAIFDIKDRASIQLQKIKTNTDTLHKSALQAQNSVFGVGRTLESLGKEQIKGARAELNQVAKSFRAMDEAVPEEFIKAARSEVLFGRGIQNAGRNLVSMAEGGRASASALLQHARAAEFAAARTDGELTPALMRAGSQLKTLAVDLRHVEETVKGTANKMTFMGDVSDRAAMNMRRLSASVQGMMFSMSALQGNLIGVAFSLIFMQFSGFLKLSIAMAGASLAVGLLWKGMSKLLALRKEAKQLADSFFVITGNTQASAIALKRAQSIAEKFGFTMGATKELTKALAQAQLQLRGNLLPIAGESLKVFTDVFTVARMQGKTAEEALDQATQGMLSFAREGAGAEVKAGAFTTTIDELSRRGVTAFQELTKAGNEERQSTQGLWLDIAFAVIAGEELGAEFNNTKTEVLDLGTTVDDVTDRIQKAFGTAIMNEMVPDTQSFFTGWMTGLEDLERDFGIRMDRMGGKARTAFGDIKEDVVYGRGTNLLYTPSPVFMGPVGPRASQRQALDIERGIDLPRGVEGAGGLSINVDVHDNNISSEEDASEIAGVISEDVLRHIRNFSPISFHPGMP